MFSPLCSVPVTLRQQRTYTMQVIFAPETLASAPSLCLHYESYFISYAFKIIPAQELPHALQNIYMSSVCESRSVSPTTIIGDAALWYVSPPHRLRRLISLLGHQSISLTRLFKHTLTLKRCSLMFSTK